MHITNTGLYGTAGQKVSHGGSTNLNKIIPGKNGMLLSEVLRSTALPTRKEQYEVM